jgi:uncharacterized protein YbcI
MSEDSVKRAQGGRLATAISNKVVRVMSEYTGRGPTRARTYLQDDLVTVLVQDTLTRGERSLVEAGRAEVVMNMRKEFQDTMQRDLVAGVQELTGREVVAFFSANHIGPDAALESFLLAPHKGVDGAGVDRAPAAPDRP